MGQGDQATMVMPAARPKAQAEEKSGPYMRFQSWASLNMPGFWRLRLEILFVGYAVLFLGAILVPVIFAGMSGPRDHSYNCDDYRYEVARQEAAAAGGSLPRIYGDDYDYRQRNEIVSKSRVACAGAIKRGYGEAPSTADYIVWTGGFNDGEQTVILTIFIILSAIIAVVWAFFMARGTRLRDVVAKTNAPGFATCMLALTPLVLLPILAGHIAFAASHGDVLNALFLGKANVQTAGGGDEIYFPSSRYNNSFNLAILLIGGLIALVFATIVKIIMYDGVMGLLRTGLIALLIGVPAVTLMVVLYQAMSYAGSRTNDMMGVIAGVLFIPLVAMWFLYQKDLMRGVRRRLTRPLALTFLVLWPLWFGFASLVVFVYFVEEFDIFDSNVVTGTLYFLGAFVVGVVMEAQLFRGVARISLLPRP